MAPSKVSPKKLQHESKELEASSSRLSPCNTIKDEFLCAICLGILKKTVTSQECFHRFCQTCITTSLCVANQECPTCRIKLTQSNLRADPTFDNIIEKLFTQKCEVASTVSRKRKLNNPEQADSSTNGAESTEPVTNGSIKKSNRKQHALIRPTRRSLRLEKSKFENEKNVAEDEYNRRLSNGSPEVFFSCLELTPTGLNTESSDNCCSYNIEAEVEKNEKQDVLPQFVNNEHEKDSNATDTKDKDDLIPQTAFNIGSDKEQPDDASRVTDVKGKDDLHPRIAPKLHSDEEQLEENFEVMEIKESKQLVQSKEPQKRKKQINVLEPVRRSVRCAMKTYQKHVIFSKANASKKHKI